MTERTCSACGIKSDRQHEGDGCHNCGRGVMREEKSSFYPPGWPRCPICGDHALDGHITCGRVGCNEGAHR